MATQVQFRRGTTGEHSGFTGAVGEVTVDTQKKTVCIHDASTLGGFPLLLEDGRPLLFTQQRLGKNKMCFDIYKLRTMKNGTPNKVTNEIQHDSYLITIFLMI